uniref:UV radiation resistance associated gene n=1 Tax=Neolamprologus brichardi TaxID=32507 RepID=A0A3Q4HR14_NEOBR
SAAMIHDINSGAFEVHESTLHAFASHSVHMGNTGTRERLRHLRSIAARNIVNRNGSPLLDTYFTLHLCLGDRISRDFYKSEVIRDSLVSKRTLKHFLSASWDRSSMLSFPVACCWRMSSLRAVKRSFSALLCPQIRSRNPNEIIFGLNDGYYAADFDQKDQSERKKNSLLQVDQSSVRNSYSVFSLLRLHTAQRAIKQTQVTVQKIGKEIEEKLRTTAACTERKKERECMQLRIAVLHSELERQRKALGRERDLRQKERALLQKKEDSFSAQHERLKEEKESLSKLQKECTAKREQFLKSNAQLTFRCRQLLSELSYIYPIDTNQSDYVICGVKLPNSEDFQAKDDGSIAVALGYTAHLVLMISCFLQIPLRYPVIHKGSRSSIKDTITDRLTEKERELSGVNDTACGSLVLQLRYQHGLTTPDLQQTLPNLKNFLEHGLMVRCDRHHVSSSIPVPTKSQLGVSAASELAYPSHTSSPDRGLRNRASSEAEAELKYKPATPPPSYNTAISEGKSQVGLEEKQEAGGAAVEEGRKTAEGESERHKENKSDEMEENPSSSSMIPNSSAVQDTDEEAMPAAQHPGAMNGSLVLEQAPISLIPELRCSVEQAEEIMGTEATGLGLGLADEARLDDYRCIPVDHAVAVECDEQVLGELDMAGFEEFSRRIYALNENMSSFRRPRKNSEK